MIQPMTRIEVYTKQVNGEVISYPSTYSYIIDSFSNMRITYGIEKRKDIITFSLINHKELRNGSYVFDYDTKYPFAEKDLVKVYAWNAPLTEGGNFEDLTDGQKDAYHVMTAYIKSYDYQSVQKTGIFSITCFNRSEVLLNSFMFAPYNDGQTVPNMIVESINRIKNYNKNDQVYAYKDYTGTSSPGTKAAYDNNNTLKIGYTGYVRAYKNGAYKNDGSGELKDAYSSTVPSDYIFPSKPYAETYKPFIEHLEFISTPDFTDDTDNGTYVYWVDGSNNLHWRSKKFSIIGTINEYNHTSVNVSKDIDEVINAVIVNCGTDPNQNGILALSFNASSMGLNGARWKYVAKTDIGESIRSDEVASGDQVIDGETVDGGANIGYMIGSDNYPNHYNWNIQTAGEDKYGNWEYVVGNPVTGIVTSNTTYKNYFRQVATAIGKKRGDEIVKQAGEALYSGTWELELGSLAYSANDMIKINIPSMNLVKDLRIMSITHNFTQGWVTTLELKEDVDYNLKKGI